MTSTPSTMRAWQFSSTKGGLPKNLTLNSSAKVPVAKANQLLVKVKVVALNPVDFKIAENPVAHALAVPKPATPGADFVGTVVTTAGGFEAGTTVFGYSSNILAGGMLADYAVTGQKEVVPLVDGVSLQDAAALPITGLTAYQCIAGRVKPKSRIFINGGSGGVGTFGIQIAKASGHDVTVTCSTRNVELCKSLGAEVIDYTQGSIVGALKKAALQGRPFDLVVDNVFHDPSLYWRMHEYTNPDAIFALTAFSPSPSVLFTFAKMKFWPSFLGGGNRRVDLITCQPKMEQLTQLRDWVKEKKIRVITDEVYPFAKVPEAYAKLKTGRAQGKIIVEVE